MRKEKGITLIALIVTIVVLLILAGITLGKIKNDDGTIEHTEEVAKNAQRESIVEKIESDLYTEKVKTGEIPSKEKLKEIISNNYGTIDKEGENEINSFTSNKGGYQINFLEIEGWKIVMSDYVKIGDYVDYEPTKKDVGKTQSIESSRLTYTSPTGGYSETEGIITHGNGYTSAEEGGGQTFTAKANDGTSTGLKWRVLSVSDDKIELISEKTVLKDNADQNSGKFVLHGGIGYLYAEQELNEVCKIYGYGYGADTSQVVTYTVGGPEDTPIIGKLRNTGARSITIEDLNKLAGITEENFTTLDSNYGDKTNPTAELYYPTLYCGAAAKNTAQSTTKKAGLKYTHYVWEKNKIDDINIQNLLFMNKYWISSRCVKTSERLTEFCLYYGVTDGVSTNIACRGTVSYITTPVGSVSAAVRPIVTLKSNVIDLTKDYETEGTWKLK